MTTMRCDIDMTPSRLDRWRQAFHAREVATLYVPEGVAFSVQGDAVLEADEGQLRQVFSNRGLAGAHRANEKNAVGGCHRQYGSKGQGPRAC